MLVSILRGELKKLDTTKHKGCSEFVKTGIVYSALLDIHLFRKRKFIFVNVHSTSLFFPVILVSQRKDITSHRNLTVFLPFDCDSCNFIRVYQYDSRPIWDFCKKICLKSEITFMLMHRGNILLCFM